MAGARHDGFVPGRFPIDGYGAGGFTFAGMSHRGSILALPSGIHKFAGTALADITPESLAPVFAEQTPVTFLIIGTGADIAFIPRPLREALKARGIAVEGMATAAAARTYNVLVAEDRPVAAVLLAVG